MTKAKDKPQVGDWDLQADAPWLQGQRAKRPSLEHVLVKAWRREEDADRKNPHAYASDAGKCSRNIGLRMASKAGILNLKGRGDTSFQAELAFKIGEEIHIAIQEAMRNSELYPEFSDEAYWQLGPADSYWLSGRADGVYTNLEGKRTILEVKTMSPGSFLMAKKNNAPNSDHLLQAMISAYALRAKEVHLVYVHKAAKSGALALMEWFIPYDHSFVMDELDRLEAIVRGVGSPTEPGGIPDRVYKGVIIEEPDLEKWPCAYCDFARMCLELGKGEYPIHAIKQKIGY